MRRIQKILRKENLLPGFVKRARRFGIRLLNIGGRTRGAACGGQKPGEEADGQAKG